MDNIVKMFIIVILILVAVLGVAGGIILGGYLFHNNKNDTVINQTTQNTSVVTPSNITATKTQSKQNSKIISASQAIAIANNYASSFNEEATGSVDYINGIGDYYGANGDPYYHVELKAKTTAQSTLPPDEQANADPTTLYASYVEIDAITGAINPRG